jgi:hypothetical protein
MERTTSITDAKEIMGDNFIGFDELKQIIEELPLVLNSYRPEIPFSRQELIKKKDDYLLIIGISKMNGSNPVTLNSMRAFFGASPEDSEPCFYNQDWYFNEDFVNLPIENKWYLVKKEIIESTRGINPKELEKTIIENQKFPSAVLCAYIFFVYFFYTKGTILWKSEYIWCSDRDHNGDQIYVGRYIDPEGVNKNGFSVHRHLSIRTNYAMIVTN